MKRAMNSDLDRSRAGAEVFWRRLFYFLSAAMGAYALVQLGDGRFAIALGDVGVVCLLLSLIPQFPFVRAIVAGGNGHLSEEQLLRDLERVRSQSPWAENVSAIGWILLGASLLLRALGLG